MTSGQIADMLTVILVIWVVGIVGVLAWSVLAPMPQSDTATLPLLSKETRQHVSGGGIFNLMGSSSTTKYILAFDRGWQGVAECDVSKDAYHRSEVGACYQFQVGAWSCSPVRRVQPPCELSDPPRPR